MKSHIEKFIEAKIKKIQLHLDSKLNQMMNLIQSHTMIVESQHSKNSNLISIILLTLRQFKHDNASKNASSSNLWAQVVSRSTTKSVKMHEKKNFAKSAKSNVWLIKCMIARFKTRISNINSIEYRNKINNVLKMYKKLDVLI